LTSDRQRATAAGVLYLITHVTSVGAVIAYDADAVRLAICLELALALACVGTGAVLWTLLRQSGPTRAATFALLRAVEAAVIVAGALPMMASVWLTAAGTVSEAATQVHAAAFLLGQGLVISVNTLVLAWLLRDSRAVPGELALLGLGGGVLVLCSNLAQLWDVIPLNGAVAGAAAVPVFAFEVWLALHLIVRGLRLDGVEAVR
jgi:hypothetical protein